MSLDEHTARVHASVLAGGDGNRLWPLTSDRAKPAVPIFGNLRIIDFILSNLFHSRVNRIAVLTQYMPESLDIHVQQGWSKIIGNNEYSSLVVKQSRRGKGRRGGDYRHTADAVAKNLHDITRFSPDIANIFAADQIYLMDARYLNKRHLETEADITISVLPVPKEDAKNFGVVEVDSNYRIKAFYEKVDNPPEMPDRPGWCLASIFNTAWKPPVLEDMIEEDQNMEFVENAKDITNPDKQTSRDFGFSIFPRALEQGRRVFAYNFGENRVAGAEDKEVGFWRDIADPDTYYDINMDMLQAIPVLNLYNKRWRIHTHSVSQTPAKVYKAILSRDADDTSSILSPGSIVSESDVFDSVLGFNSRIIGGRVEEAILMGENEVYGTVQRAILNKGVDVPKDKVVSPETIEVNEANGVYKTPGGILVLDKRAKF